MLYAHLYISDIRLDPGDYSSDAIDFVRLRYPFIGLGIGFAIGVVAQLLTKKPNA